MHRADNDELRGGHVDGEENPPLRRLLHAAFAGSQMLGKDAAQWIYGDVGRRHQALFASGDVGHDDRGATRGALGIQGGEQIKLHVKS